MQITQICDLCRLLDEFTRYIYGLNVWLRHSVPQPAPAHPRRRRAGNSALVARCSSSLSSPRRKMAAGGADPEHMQRAIALAYKAGLEEKTGRPFGSVIVGADGRVLAEGYNQVRRMGHPAALPQA